LSETFQKHKSAFNLHVGREMVSYSFAQLIFM